jgi:hypothetical protein
VGRERDQQLCFNSTEMACKRLQEISSSKKRFPLPEKMICTLRSFYGRHTLNLLKTYSGRNEAAHKRKRPLPLIKVSSIGLHSTSREVKTAILTRFIYRMALVMQAGIVPVLEIFVNP